MFWSEILHNLFWSTGFVESVTYWSRFQICRSRAMKFSFGTSETPTMKGNTGSDSGFYQIGSNLHVTSIKNRFFGSPSFWEVHLNYFFLVTWCFVCGPDPSSLTIVAKIGKDIITEKVWITFQARPSRGEGTGYMNCHLGNPESPWYCTCLCICFVMWIMIHCILYVVCSYILQSWSDRQNLRHFGTVTPGHWYLMLSWNSQERWGWHKKRWLLIHMFAWFYYTH